MGQTILQLIKRTIDLLGNLPHSPLIGVTALLAEVLQGKYGDAVMFTRCSQPAVDVLAQICIENKQLGSVRIMLGNVVQHVAGSWKYLQERFFCPAVKLQ